MKALANSSLAAPRPIWVEVGEPNLGAGQVLIRARAAGLDARWARRMVGFEDGLPDGPRLLGEIATGVVLEVCGNCAGLSEGRAVLVLADGCCSEKIVAPADGVHVLPDGCDLALVAGLSEYLLAQSILTDALPKIARPTIWVASLDRGLGQALAFLAPPDVTLLTAAVHDRSDGADLVIDCEAGSRFNDRLALLADFGGILICGRRGGDPPNFFDTLWTHLDLCPELQFWSLQRYASDHARFGQILQSVLDTIGNRGWPAGMEIKPLAAAPDVYSEVEDGEPRAGIAFAFPEPGG